MGMGPLVTLNTCKARPRGIKYQLISFELESSKGGAAYISGKDGHGVQELTAYGKECNRRWEGHDSLGVLSWGRVRWSATVLGRNEQQL